MSELILNKLKFGERKIHFFLNMGNETSQTSVPPQFKKIRTLDDSTLLDYLRKKSKIEQWCVIYLYTLTCLIVYTVI